VSRVAAALDANTDARFSALSASFGVAVFPHDGSDEEALLRVADESMYEGKALGADRAKLEAQ
jgi:GGDEF domain-containing protein